MASCRDKSNSAEGRQWAYQKSRGADGTPLYCMTLRSRNAVIEPGEWRCAQYREERNGKGSCASAQQHKEQREGQQLTITKGLIQSNHSRYNNNYKCAHSCQKSEAPFELQMNHTSRAVQGACGTGNVDIPRVGVLRDSQCSLKDRQHLHRIPMTHGTVT